MRKNARKQVKNSNSLSYDPLEQRQVLTAGLGLNVIGATNAIPGIDSLLPNPEGDVGPNHYVEFGEQTYTVYDRDGVIVEAQTLNEFYLDAGGDLFGEDLSNPRVIYDRATERWFATANGNGEGPFAGNWLHVAFSDTSDPTGQWQQVQFVPDITGLRLADNLTFGVDADGVYLATQNFINGALEDVSIFSLPKADLFLANPTLANITRFDNLSFNEYGTTIQFASNFEASDGSVFAFSTQANGPQGILNPSLVNSFEISNAATDTATLSTPEIIFVDPGLSNPLVAPIPLQQPTEDAGGNLVSASLQIEGGLTSSLIEANGSVFAAQTVGQGFVEGVADIRVNGVHWFQLNVEAGEVPELAESPLRGPVTHLIIDNLLLGDNIPDPVFPTLEFGAESFFNPSISVSESGLVSLIYNGLTMFDAVDFGAVTLADAVRVSSYASVGLMVNGAQTGTDADDNPVFGRNSIQLEDPVLIRESTAGDAFIQTGMGANVWGAYSSLRPDPANPNAFFATIPFAEDNSDEWAVQIAELLPTELRPVIEGTASGDEIVIRLAADNTEFVEIEFNGVVSDRIERSLLDQIIILGHDGADSFLIDHTNGDPTPVGGLILDGGLGTDTITTNSPDNHDVLIDSLNAPALGIFYPGYLAPFLADSDDRGTPLNDIAGEADGFLTRTTDAGMEIPAESQIAVRLVDVETVRTDAGDDTFTFEVGPLGGNAEGGDGDDRFVFVGPATVDGSINGGAGFNTLDLQQRNAGTQIELFSIGQNTGFNGRTLTGPVGQFNEVLDQFRDISLVRGSAVDINDSIQSLNQFETTYTIVNPNITPDDIANPADATTFVASTLEAAGRKLYLTDFDVYIGSVLDDTFNVRENNLNTLTLDGRTGDDEFNFSSDADANTGVLAGIEGTVFVEGGGGGNVLNISDEGRFEELAEYLVLSARVSGPVEIVYLDNFAGNFEVNLIGSDSSVDRFILQSFLPTNTLNVFGRNGDDIFVIQDLSQAPVELFGGEGDDEYIIEQVNGIDDRNVIIVDSVGTENDRAIIAGTLLDEVFIVDLDSFVSDQFTFIGIEEFGFDGRGGDDEFYVREISAEFPIILRGGAGNDIFFVSSDAPTNLGDLSLLNNNLTIDAISGIDQIQISNESGAPLDVEITSTQITGLFNGVLNYTASEGGVFGLVDGDGNLDDENFGGISIIGTNSLVDGDDTFLVSSFFQQHSLAIDGRLGEDEFILGDGSTGDINGVVVVDGASGGDTYRFLLGDLAGSNVIIEDSGFSGIDTLVAEGTLADDNVSVTEFQITSTLGTIQIGSFIEEIEIDTLGGDDTLSLTNAPAGLVTFDAGDGNDQINVSGTVGVNGLLLLGGGDNDVISISESSALTAIQANGGTGDDRFEIGAAVFGDIDADGGAGSDHYDVDFVDGGSRTVTIADSGAGMEDFDDATLIGNIVANEFFVDSTSVSLGTESVQFGMSIEFLSVFSGGGDDIFNVTDTVIDTTLGGQAGNDIYNLSSAAPTPTGNTAGILGHLNIAAGPGLNHLNVTNASGTASEVTIATTSISGLTAGGITFSAVGGAFDRADGEIGGIQIIGADGGGDTFNIDGLLPENSLRIYGLGGNDTFNIGNGAQGDMMLDGGEDSDTYNFQFGSSVGRDVVIDDSGASGVDSLLLSGSADDDNVIISTDGISDGLSNLSFNIPLTMIEIMGLGGNDTFTINGGPTSTVNLHGNGGNDTFIVNGTEGIDDLNLFAGDNMDDFTFNGSLSTTRIDALGGAGADTFTVGAGAQARLFLDGEEGSDSYAVFFAGEGDRRIDTRDSGINGTDQTQAFGTTGADRIAVRTTRFLYDDEVVIFDENTESILLNTGDGEDRAVFFGSRSPIAEVFTGADDDNFVINGGARANLINLNGGDGDDTYLVRRTSVDTTTNLFGGNGNDRFSVGSTINQDNGNLGLIRGELNVFGGSNDAGEEDQLLINDNGVNAAYSYSITPSSVTAIPGPTGLDRDIFAGINYNASTELLRLDGTPQANLFEVTASQTTRFFFDGNSPDSSTFNGDQLNLNFQANDGRELFITNASLGQGFITFTNGNEIIQFDNFETQVLLNGPANFAFPPGFDLDSLLPERSNGANFAPLAGSEEVGDDDQTVDDFFSTADLDDWSEIDDSMV